MHQDRHTLLAMQQVVKRKARKERFPAFQDGERVVYCVRCLRGSYEVEWMAWEPFFCVCSDCIRDLAIFMEHSFEKHGEMDEGAGKVDD